VPERDAYKVLQVDPEATDVVIQAAYRALARRYHPDHGESQASTRRMAELNDAYSKVRSADRRALYDRQRARGGVQAPIVAPPPPGSNARGTDHRVLDFGRYEGWTIAKLAQHDPDYLRWLSRHSSGIRFRAEIQAALDSVAPASSRRPKGR
jgi:curved DNA-binding protein CbpA